MNERDVRQRCVLTEQPVNIRGTYLRILSVVDDRNASVEDLANLDDALAVRTVDRHEHVSVARHQRSDCRFDGKCAAALKWNAFMRPGAMRDLQQRFAKAGGDRVEVGIPRTPVAQHALLGSRRRRQRTRSE